MALQFVGATNGIGTNDDYYVSLSGSLAGGIASSPAAGDLVVVVSAFGNTTSSAPAVSGNVTGAYTGFNAPVHVNDIWDTEFGTFYAVMGGTPDTTLTITRATNAAYGGATVVMVFRGQRITTPIYSNSAYTTITNASRAVPASPMVNTVGDFVVAMAAGTQGTTGSSFTVPVELTSGNRSVKADGTTSDIGVWMAYQSASSTGTFTISAATGGTTSTNSSGAAHSFVIAGIVTHSTSGSLTGQGSAVAGSANRLRAFATSGVLIGPGSIIVGTADWSCAKSKDSRFIKAFVTNFAS